jgi:hypothetical protein
MKHIEQENIIENNNFDIMQTITLNLDLEMRDKLHKYFLLEQCIYIYNKDIVKVREIFNILNNLYCEDDDIILIREFYNAYLFIATECSCGIEIMKIIFEKIKNNKYKIMFKDLDDFFQDFIEINDYIEANQNKHKLNWRRFEKCTVSHLTCINNLIRDNNIDELQLYHDNKLIIEDYYDDIKDSLIFFKCNKSTLNFFKKNFKIKIDKNIN